MNKLNQNIEKRVLVVDDEPELRELIRDFLESSGYTVAEAANGTEANKMVAEGKYCAVISDIRMPNGDGVQLLANIRKDNHKLPAILLVTGFSDVNAQVAYDIGADGYFSKPIDFDALLGALNKCLLPVEERWARIDKRVEINFKINLKQTNLESALSGHVMNIGRGGMFVHVDSNYPKLESVINFSVEFEEAKKIEGTGQVRWVRFTPGKENLPTGFGLEFIQLTAESTKIIKDLLEKKDPSSYIPKK